MNDESNTIDRLMMKYNFTTRQIAGKETPSTRYINTAINEGFDLIEGMIVPFAIDYDRSLHYGYELVGNETRHAIELVEQVQQDYAIDRMWR